MEQSFPRTEVAGVSLSRMIIGTNWFLGWSHRGSAADQMIRERYHDKESIFPVLNAFLNDGIDTIMGPISQNTLMLNAIDYAQQKTGKRMILVDTPILNVSDSR